MKSTTSETKIMTRQQFDAAIAELCGWTEIDGETHTGRSRAGVGILPIPKVSSNALVAWDILRVVKEEDPETFYEMSRLLTLGELADAPLTELAFKICNALYQVKTGCDVEIEELEDFEEW